ncbi:tRNA-(ms[2]io[6]A)-hydroxylase [Microbulbifer thermotolerans]|uniref:tRNA hydroxylase n=1 Tax=Microbulbifer thermotolerans TaxID=252514 RepID=A0A143HLX6_MICTH|nr:tRNA isopentenyl-2-thiomethyl-A-37 hydroxylase MiaE [Microbulbifer thermotolerans]AMX02693.1 tRNA hydroxylase [Microbulbifer thermotolerans]MCX2780372.1 tRNA-(ms[2]io[6]A)-hydroxylase [Microbulbifer thermotolerans]MCX2805956.1 tRNA-(ms[2]io[6]A)-hydroxylase [Microbulbifer thermotolerans]MCX2832640.1 tRNA-(ms[2]io[6]A)-hydroxylase [Microbulbifer thermotolerans]
MSDPIPDLSAIRDFLLCPTPDAWVQAALAEPELMLVDHANCEKKAAGTALNLMFRYLNDFELLNKMSRLAREELRHFEQVLAIMEKRGIDYPHISASRYAAALRAEVRTREPDRLVDTLICGAIIEARSCERFARVAPYLDEELQKFYVSLLKSEARHFRDYLSLARKAAGRDIYSRVQQLLEVEQALVEGEDGEFRFHSGVPAARPTAESVT